MAKRVHRPREDAEFNLITGAPSCVLLKEGAAVAHGTGPMTIVEVRKFLDGHL